MKILALTDLSPLSKVGVIYAANLCVALNSKLIVMNVLNIDKLTQIRSGFNDNDEVIKMLTMKRENECLDFIEQVRDEVVGDFNPELFIEKSNSVFFEELVDTFSVNHKCNLIVMSTKGASGIKKHILGSNAAAVIGNNNSIPVLTIPEYASFKGLKNFVYATDMKRLSEEFAVVLSLVKLLNSSITVLHICQSNNLPKFNEAAMAKNLRDSFGYEKINCVYILNSEVKRGIEQYLNGRNADIIAMFSCKPSFVGRLLKRSNSREMVSGSYVPILTFSNNEAVVVVR